MSGIFDQPDDAATPLTEQDRQSLKLSYVATRADLNVAEQDNIARGQDWALRRKRNIVDERFMLNLHRHMFADVWRWAGKYRTTELNLGIDYWQIPTEMQVLFDDVKLWIEKHVFPPDEIAVRFRHRLTQIHAFPNGNGRHARLIADLLVMQLGGERFTWGKGSLRDAGELRKNYIAALHAADNHDVEPLLAFARS